MSEYGKVNRIARMIKIDERRKRNLRRWLYNMNDDGYLFGWLIVVSLLSTIPWILWGIWKR